jgi:aspartate racemase
LKKIGMIGGLSWLSSAEYYRLVNEMVADKLGDEASAHLIMESVNRAPYVEYVNRRQDEISAEKIVMDAVHSVIAGGADFVVLCCNDIHRFVPNIECNISLPILHIADVTANSINQAGLDKVGLLGVRKTMEGTFYSDRLKTHGIDTIVPELSEQNVIHHFLMDEVVKGVFSSEAKQSFLDVIESLKDRGAQGIILGCTEIPLLINQQDIDIPAFSTTHLHCEAAVRMALC